MVGFLVEEGVIRVKDCSDKEYYFIDEILIL